MATVYREEEVQSGHNKTMKVFTEAHLQAIKKKLWHSCIDPCVRAVRFDFQTVRPRLNLQRFKRIHPQRSLYYAPRGTNRLPPTLRLTLTCVTFPNV